MQSIKRILEIFCVLLGTIIHNIIIIIIINEILYPSLGIKGMVKNISFKSSTNPDRVQMHHMVHCQFLGM